MTVEFDEVNQLPRPEDAITADQVPNYAMAGWLIKTGIVKNSDTATFLLLAVAGACIAITIFFATHNIFIPKPPDNILEINKPTKRINLSQTNANL